MEEDLISFETAKLAKEKGFDEKTEFQVFEGTKLYYTKERGRNSEYGSKMYARCLQSVLQRWLRKNYDLHVNVRQTCDKGIY